MKLRLRKLIALGGLILIFDQLIKWQLTHFYPEYIRKNFGLAFGVNITWQNVFWLFFLILILILFTLTKPGKKENLSCYGEFLILSGIISNFIDRVFRQGVIDYIKIGDLMWFNLADVAITAGILMLTSQFLCKKKLQ